MHRSIFFFAIGAVFAAQSPSKPQSSLPSPGAMRINVGPRRTQQSRPVSDAIGAVFAAQRPSKPQSSLLSPEAMSNAAPPRTQQSRPVSFIIKQTNDIGQDGSYNSSYENDNGIAAEEKGELLNAPKGPVVVSGSFRYMLDGRPISLTYVANENGFQPIGDHLPVSPPIPPLIARALEWNAAHPEPIKEN